MPKAKQPKEEQQKQPDVADKKIKKGKKTKEQAPQPDPVSPPQSPVKKGKKQQDKKPKVTKEKFNRKFYPETPNQQFPNQLQENVFSVIASFGKSASIKEITTNLALFYTNTVVENAVHQFLAQAEESGIIYERNGQYFVSDELVPTLPEEPQVQQPKPETPQKQLIQDQEPIDFEDAVGQLQSEKKNIIDMEDVQNFEN